MPSPKSKAPKARIMYAATDTYDEPLYGALAHFPTLARDSHIGCVHNKPVLVLPCANRQSARARLRWERLSESEKIEALRELLKRTWNQTHEATAKAILSLQSSPAKGGREK